MEERAREAKEELSDKIGLIGERKMGNGKQFRKNGHI